MCRRDQIKRDAKLELCGVVILIICIFLSGCQERGYPTSVAESAIVEVEAWNGLIIIKLVEVGNNYPDSGYSFSKHIEIRFNGELLDDTTGFETDNSGWNEEESLFVGYGADNKVDLDDEWSDLQKLPANEYSITVMVKNTVIFDDIITID